ncbi:MAG: hypothetical protein ACM3X9_10035 [Bacillota bacterium]
MAENALLIKESPDQRIHKSKPRYTEAENKLIFDSWWNPQKRRELKNRLGREMNALRSQFCRLLKEKGLSNQEYYNTMEAKHRNDESGRIPKRSHELKEIDRVILETFCRHQVEGNSRTQACAELQEKLGARFTPAALKLRFYRLIKAMQYSENDLLKIGKGIGVQPDSVSVNELQSPAVETASAPVETGEREHPADTYQPSKDEDRSFFYQISSLPETVRKIGERVSIIEEQQRRQLDLRGFIEHLLAVERDLKREDKMMEEIQKLLAENDGIRSLMEKERERLKKREEELTEVYRILETMLGDFMKLESVSKLASLGDFMHRLEITVDQFGNVLKSKRVAG